MTRAIKFRAVDKKTNKIYDVIGFGNLKPESFYKVLSIEESEDFVCFVKDYSAMITYHGKNYGIKKLYDFTLIQFTGLKDATKWKQLTEKEQKKWIGYKKKKEDWKGKDIYEGDIIRVWNDEKYTTIVKIPEFYYFIHELGDIPNEEYKVIGNKFKNPKLLEEGDSE